MDRCSLTTSCQCICVWGPLLQLPVPTTVLWDVVVPPPSQAVPRLQCFGKVLKIIKNLPGLLFRKNAAEEKKNVRRRKYPFSSSITPSVRAPFPPAQHLPSGDMAWPAPGHPCRTKCPLPCAHPGSRLSHTLSW